MSVERYLRKRASDAVLSSSEKDSINTSISTLQVRLNSYFGNDLEAHFQFGSSTRGTILPRNMDSESDIDYMVVFKDTGHKSQTYLDRLRRFVERYYSSSSIKQSHPTIVLELNHIKFELVPALPTFWSEYKIPDRKGEWQTTDPNDFNNTLTNVNKNNNSLVKPAIRLVKYWNASNGYVYDSYKLEVYIVNQSFWFCTGQKDYVFKVFDSLNTGHLNQVNRAKVDKAKAIIKKTRELEEEDYPALAESEVKKLIPE